MRFPSIPLICCLLASLAARPAAAEYLVLKGGNDVRVVSDVPLGPNTKKPFRQIDQDDDFAAFTVNFTADEAGTIRMMGSLESAVKLSLASCRQRSAGKGGTCELYAVVVPRDYPKGARYVDAFNQLGSRGFTTYLNDVRTSKGGYGALVYSNYGAWGWSWGQESRAAAVESATLQCEGEVSRALADTTAQTRAIARKDRSLTDCFTVDVRTK